MTLGHIIFLVVFFYSFYRSLDEFTGTRG